MMNKALKKIAIALAAATMTLSASSVVTFANDGMGIDSMSNVTVQDIDQQMYIIAKSGANVRTMPSTDGRIITALECDRLIRVTGKTSNGWYRTWVTDPVSGGQSSGYIAGTLLSTTKGGSQSAVTILPATPSTSTSTKYNSKYPWIMETNSSNTTKIKAQRGEMSHDNDTFTVSVPDGYLALRSSAVTDPANEIGQLKSGQMVQVKTYGTQFDYVYVPATGASGYVNNDYLIG